MTSKTHHKVILREYLYQNPDDELWSSLKGSEWESVQKSWMNAGADQRWGSCVVHHIFGGGVGHRIHTWSNLVTVSAISHDFCHRHVRLGLAASVWVKIRKGEFDRETMRNECGRDVVAILTNWRDTDGLSEPYAGFVHYIERNADDPPSRPLPFTEQAVALGEGAPCEGEAEATDSERGGEGD